MYGGRTKLRNEHWNYTRKNALSHISLHDCECARMYGMGNQLVMEMGWIEILRTHPDNPFPQAYQSRRGVIRFESLRQFHGEMTAHTAAGAQAVCIEDITLLQLVEIEILSFAVTPEDAGYHAEIFAVTDRGDEVLLQFSFAESVMQWNDFSDVSWFEPMQ